ncbi:MAG: hypothetical protein FWF15_07075 [Oscillospiraceae bacterium]|nr:hypothetical protein [Oscillospiraceae bacterium]
MKKFFTVFMVVLLSIALTLPSFAQINMIFLDTDSAKVDGMLVGSGQGAYKNKYVYGEVNGSGTATFEVDITEAGKYHIWCNVYGLHSEANSFFVLVDGKGFNDAPYTFDFYEIPLEVYVPTTNNPFILSNEDMDNDELFYNLWYWMPLSYRDATGDPQTRFNYLVFDFSVGKHTIEFTTREPECMMDRILITDDLSFDPYKLGSDPEVWYNAYLESLIIIEEEEAAAAAAEEAAQVTVTPTVPQTGESIMLSTIIFALAAISLILTIQIRRQKCK